MVQSSENSVYSGKMSLVSNMVIFPTEIRNSPQKMVLPRFASNLPFPTSEKKKNNILFLKQVWSLSLFAHQGSHGQKIRVPYFPWNTGCLIGILSMVFFDPYITGSYNTLNPKQPINFLLAQVTQVVQWFYVDFGVHGNPRILHHPTTSYPDLTNNWLPGMEDREGEDTNNFNHLKRHEKKYVKFV